jgi:transcriptional regulator with XRE-family HTH domain
MARAKPTLRTLRARAGLGLEVAAACARALGGRCSASFLSRLERGSPTHPASRDTLKVLARVYRRSVGEVHAAYIESVRRWQPHGRGDLEGVRALQAERRVRSGFRQKKTERKTA